LPENKVTSPADKYSSFLKSIKLIGLGLENCSASLNRDLYSRLLSRKNTSRTITSEYELTEVHDTHFDVSARLTVHVEDKDKTTRSLSIQCAFAAHFHCARLDTGKDYAERFTQSELRLIMWPYFREFVSDVSSKMAIPPLLIPLSAST